MVAVTDEPDLRTQAGRLRHARMRKHSSMRGAATAHGWNENTYKSHEQGIRRDGALTEDDARRYARAFGVSLSWLLTGRGEVVGDAPPDTAGMVRIIGKVGANPDDSIIYTTADDVWDMAPVPPGGTDKSVGLEVVGHSMRWVAEDGSLIYFEDQRNPPGPDLLGLVVIVETEDEQVLVKRLLRGSEPGLFDLESQNGATLSDRRLRWAAEITAIIPPRQARRIIKRDVAARHAMASGSPIRAAAPASSSARRSALLSHHPRRASASAVAICGGGGGALKYSHGTV